MATFTNQATLIYNGRATSSNVTTGELVDALTFTKTAISDGYTDDGRVIYALSIVNGGSAITGATVVDNLGAYTVGAATVYPLAYVDGSVRLYINGAEATPPTVVPGPPLSFENVNVPEGGNAIILYEAETTEYAPLISGSQITNNATLTSGASTLDSEETVTVRDYVRLSIAKSICPATVTDNGTLTYTFIIQNTGNTPVVATDNLIVTDTFNPILNPISVTYNGEPWTEGTQYTYDETTGDFATTEGSITVPAATYVQDPVTGLYSSQPGVAVITITGTV